MQIFTGNAIKTVVFNKVSKSKRRSKILLPKYQLLLDADLINLCYQLSNLDLLLEGNYVRNKFKVYLNDIGLLLQRINKTIQQDFMVKKYDKF